MQAYPCLVSRPHFSSRPKRFAVEGLGKAYPCCSCHGSRSWISEAYLLKLGKNLSWDFEVIYICSKNVVLNVCRYLKGTLSLTKKQSYGYQQCVQDFVLLNVQLI